MTAIKSTIGRNRNPEEQELEDSRDPSKREEALSVRLASGKPVPPWRRDVSDRGAEIRAHGLPVENDERLVALCAVTGTALSKLRGRMSDAPWKPDDDRDRYIKGVDAVINLYPETESGLSDKAFLLVSILNQIQEERGDLTYAELLARSLAVEVVDAADRNANRNAEGGGA